MRKKIVAGNWKMNTTFSEATSLAWDIFSLVPTVTDKTVLLIVAPPFPFIEGVSGKLKGADNVFVAAQNCSFEESGAFTGEVSVAMLASMTVDYVIVGHSERRRLYNETSEELSKKIQLSIKHKVIPIYCVGETLPEREASQHFNVVQEQLEKALWILTTEDASQVVIAYEPVWAIGTGKTATAAQAQEMHAFIRQLISEKFGKNVSENISILYGGSCNPQNAAELFACPDIDGGLIGGASLKAKDFITIAQYL